MPKSSITPPRRQSQNNNTMPKKPASRLLVYTIWAISFTATIITHAEDAIFPPKELRAEWEELQELKFADWSIEEFLGWDTPFDGGSKVFFFESDGGEKFELVIANPSYWTNKDKKERRQVFIVVHKNRFYRIEPKSDANRISNDFAHRRDSQYL